MRPKIAKPTWRSSLSPYAVTFLEKLPLASDVKRSNVESTCSAIKRKFGDSVMSRSDAGMVNEVLCKVLCHNLTCLIQEQETLGITPVFWKDEGEQANETPAILPTVRGG